MREDTDFDDDLLDEEGGGAGEPPVHLRPSEKDEA